MADVPAAAAAVGQPAPLAAGAWLQAEDLQPEDGSARHQVYLVTFAAVLDATALAAGVSLRTLEGATRADIRDAVLDAVANPVAERPALGGRPRVEPLAALKLVVFLEDPRHFHVALKLSKQNRFLPLKIALRARSGFATHWSTSHRQFWSAVRYGAMASAKKPDVDSEPLVWTPNGLGLDLFAESQEPFNAKALKRRREEAMMSTGAKQGRGPEFSKLDFTALVLAESLKTPAQVMAYVQEKGSFAMQGFINKHQGRLREYLEHASEWARAQQDAEAEKESDWALVQRLAQGTCACGMGACAWRQAADAFFDRNVGTMDRHRLAACFADVLRAGPAKTRRVPLLVGPTNSGKSTIFNPVDRVFGDSAVFHTPALASCALANLALQPKRFMYLDEFRPVEYATTPARTPAISCITFLKLFQGQWIEIQVSQSHNNGHKDMQWQRGVAMTAKLQGLWDPKGQVGQEEIRHMQARVEQFTAAEAVAGVLADVPACPESFCRWLVEDSAEWAMGAVPPPLLPFVDASASGQISGFRDVALQAALPTPASVALHDECLALGAVHVAELTVHDWTRLRAWQLLRPLQQRRLHRTPAKYGARERAGVRGCTVCQPQTLYSASTTMRFPESARRDGPDLHATMSPDKRGCTACDCTHATFLCVVACSRPCVS